MKAFEFLTETGDYESRLKDEARNVLIASKAAGIETIDVDQFVDHLNAAGFSVTRDSVSSLLVDMPFVSDEGDTIRVAGDPDSDTERTPEKNREVVSNLASKAAKRGIR